MITLKRNACGLSQKWLLHCATYPKLREEKLHKVCSMLLHGAAIQRINVSNLTRSNHIKNIVQINPQFSRLGFQFLINGTYGHFVKYNIQLLVNSSAACYIILSQRI